jgi:hypothetical protein
MRKGRGAPTQTKKMLQLKANYVTSERDAKRARLAGAIYATSERDAKRARRADANNKILQPNPSSECAFIRFFKKKSCDNL